MLRFNFDVPPSFLPMMGWGLVFLLPAHAAACRLAGLYRGIWMFASLPDLKRVLRAVGMSTAALLVFFDFRDSPVRLWQGFGTLTSGGHDWPESGASTRTSCGTRSPRTWSATGPTF